MVLPTESATLPAARGPTDGHPAALAHQAHGETGCAPPGLLRWLGLIPLLAMSTTVLDALLAGIAAALTLGVASATRYAVRAILPDELRMPALMTMLAAFVGALALAMQAWLPASHAANAPYLPLLAIHGALGACLATPQSLYRAVRDGFAMGAGSLAALLAVGALREFIGEPFGFALTPSAAFLLLALLLALKNRIARS